MKKISKYLIIATLFSLLFSSCVKDELIEVDEVITTDLGLFVNEVFSTGDPDWIEIYNSNDEDIDMSGFKISDGPVAKYTFPSGTTIAANSYLVYPCNEFGLSSGGEEVYFWDASDNLIDNITFPALDAGVAYGRTSDGGDTFTTMAPSQGAANSNENSAPFIEASLIEAINDNEVYKYEVIASDASGMRDVKLFIETENNVFFEEMAPLGGGDYQFNIPVMTAGTIAEYYVVATDETGKKSYFPQDAPDTKATFIVADGLAVFTDLAISTENPASGEEVVVTATVYDNGGIDELRLYYVLNDDIADNKEKIIMTDNGDGTYSATIPGQADNTVINYYLRAEDLAGLKSYYPTEEYDSEGNVIGSFDHDIETTWPSVTVAPLEIIEALVINELQGGGDPDYIELYNGTASEMDISGYQLHDSDPTEAYTIPAGTTIAAGGFYVLNCDGDATTLFKISSSGEDITLLDASGAVVDQLLKDNWPVDHSALVGRTVDGAVKWVVLDTASKGTSNN
ncbi:MAG: lamin tail domain-containing protein [Bacteroidetes bacterium]|nr:lamin tail domain-containing protein [Bacteroidota bacterium]